ncbi:MAG: CoA-binding protein [Desulfomonilia bacterium]|jgi:acyl-CoA synthetase (NDP forming)|uniref:Succinyl-CoA ligase (ADP-forming) subunit alpha n=1 Tax=anaerobic digester metagenome TaxID=1263854 RepID=A0A485LX62_9ZZZZ|nr:CoA-binding protein [Pseudomonadota bacterium]HON38986.1 CoA-binding protein [Deltaproteobacteria bacterium]HRS56964.1 CoA-binding protein [Desulfomonilia bacterium]HPD22099.1 CoA-binding protein [Deltaproteobacteria bacterium]HPX18937.1 CoA-binding protein [Deltaproteobacteria bacterium]
MESAITEPARDAFDRIFHPKSVAVIGVSASGYAFGTGILSSLKAIGFEGRLYAVNPKGGEYNGMKIYTGLSMIPEPIDLAVIAVPAERVPNALEECRRMGVAGVEILSAGFSEIGTEAGARLEQEIRDIASRGIRVVGPNCFGIYCPQSGLTLLPGPDLSRKSGPVGFVSQSGGMAIDFAHIGKWMGVGFSKMVSFGNGADLRETELLEYFGRDPETRVIAMYIEGVKDGKRFFSVLKDVAARKPVIVNKGGLTEAGSRAVESHTASMGGSKRIWEAVLRQAGAVQVGDLWEMAQTCLAFSLLPPRVYEHITVAGGGGALGVSACDQAELYGLNIPQLDPEITKAILEHLPRPGSSAKNPIDAANPFVGPQAYREVFLKAAGDQRVDAQILIQLLYHYKSLSSAMGLSSPKEIAPYRQLADEMKGVVDATGKPLMLVVPNIKQGVESMDIEEMIREARAIFLDRGIPVFDDLGHCLRALGHVSRYYALRRARGL